MSALGYWEMRGLPVRTESGRRRPAHLPSRGEEAVAAPFAGEFGERDDRDILLTGSADVLSTPRVGDGADGGEGDRVGEVGFRSTSAWRYTGSADRTCRRIPSGNSKS